MKSIRMHGIAMLLSLAAVSGMAPAAGVEDVVRDTQRLVAEDGHVSMVWWMPLEFWDGSLANNPDMPEATRKELVGVMAPYTVVALLRAETVGNGLGEIKSKEDLQKNTRFTINGTAMQALPAEQVSQPATLMISQLKPVLAEAAGQLGEAMEFLVFPSGVDDKLMVDATMPGNLTINFYGRDFKWRLPLGSVLPPRIDKATGEEFPGNYEYNPFTGRKIDAGAAATKPAAAKPSAPATKPAAPATKSDKPATK
jgi:hypothetical protein